MSKPYFSKIVNKVKAGAGEAVEQVKTGAIEAVEQVKASADSVAGKMKAKANGIKEAKEKYIKKAEAAMEKPKNVEKDRNSAKKKEPDAKEKLDDTLRLAADQYNEAYTTMNDNGATLYRERTRAVDMIIHIEGLINSIANRPKEFDAEIAEIKTQRQSYVDACEFAKIELEAAKRSALGAGAGIATGAAIVSVAPTVAMWVATTFGTASTGTAISALSGAAAQSAALAWLGGGALTVGGGGMAAGNAFLALAGPVGWGVAGVTLLSSIVLFSFNKLKLEKKKKEEIEAIKQNTITTKKIAAQIQQLLDEVVALRSKLSQQYHDCLTEYGKDFTLIPKEQQIQLGALVNNTKALAASLDKSI